ncbi:MAG: AbrB/MazE/SpoVT family DNA-binding domain-containing protein [Thermofilum sp.]|uniref:SpoVT-AbrB domain-containing protein n=2 Tax=Thermofilaceae TaxID=114378 RepID=S5ZEN1_9CREN|nr:hypothetical protein N186_06070 [Thermofilum adornatum]
MTRDKVKYMSGFFDIIIGSPKRMKVPTQINLNILSPTILVMRKIKELKVGRKGQIVIPKELREEFNIKEGGIILVKKADGKILLIPKPEDPVDFLLQIAQKVKLRDLRREIKEFRRDTKRDLS